jgi:hypothetical protein
MRHTPILSLWHCDLCQVQVAIQGRPRRLRHTRCRKWMAFRYEVYPDPAQAAQLRAALLAAARVRRPPPPATP